MRAGKGGAGAGDAEAEGGFVQFHFGLVKKFFAVDEALDAVGADADAEAIGLANDIAVEHLELMVRDPWSLIPHIRHAGAIFLGSYTPEAAGDYLAGPNHVLPTMGTARFASALGVETFLKKSSIISYSREALAADSGHIRLLANLEGLTAHAASVTERLKG